MLKSIQPIEADKTNYKILKGNTFNFGLGLNIITGPNGIGKTTLLRLIANSVGCPEFDGWSRKANIPKHLKTFNTNNLVGRKHGEEIQKIEALSEIDWDGNLVYSHLAKRALHFDFYDKDSIDFGHSLTQICGSNSTGEKRIQALNALMMTIIKNPVPENRLSEVPTDTLLDRSSKMTLLLDEPEKNLDINNQYLIWSNYIPAFLEAGYQVLISTHCPFMFLSKKYKNTTTNILELTNGFVDKMAKNLSHLSKLV